MIPILDIQNKHYDIYFLEKKLLELVVKENYERAITLKRWIRELAYLHHGLTEEEVERLLKFKINEKSLHCNEKRL
jgi:hypothetical protein